MVKKTLLTDEEVSELFSEVDHSGVVDPSWRTKGEESAAQRAQERLARRSGRAVVDPLSYEDPSGSRVGHTISRTALAVILGVFALVLGMQIVYGVNRRLNTANLSERVTAESVEHALRSGVEWGDGFTQFPSEFTVDEANERTGVVEVSVVDTTSTNELELLSNSQIQASALSTNALVNEKINRVIYNVYARVDDQGNFQHDHFFGLIRAGGTKRAMLSFVWTKEESATSNYIDWQLRIIGMDEDLTKKLQEQVNSVSSIIEEPGISQEDINDMRNQEAQDLLDRDATALTGTGTSAGATAQADTGTTAQAGTDATSQAGSTGAAS